VTTYRVPVSDPLLTERDFWKSAEGFRLVSVDGPWLAHPGETICTFEDDAAPPELEGKLVAPVLKTEDDGRVHVVGRSVVTW
jgi:hypothetical protein